MKQNEIKRKINNLLASHYSPFIACTLVQTITIFCLDDFNTFVTSPVASTIADHESFSTQMSEPTKVQVRLCHLCALNHLMEPISFRKTPQVFKLAFKIYITSDFFFLLTLFLILFEQSSVRHMTVLKQF